MALVRPLGGLLQGHRNLLKMAVALVGIIHYPYRFQLERYMKIMFGSVQRALQTSEGIRQNRVVIKHK
jgi:hypothetical protein